MQFNNNKNTNSYFIHKTHFEVKYLENINKRVILERNTLVPSPYTTWSRDNRKLLSVFSYWGWTKLLKLFELTYPSAAWDLRDIAVCSVCSVLMVNEPSWSSCVCLCRNLAADGPSAAAEVRAVPDLRAPHRSAAHRSETSRRDLAAALRNQPDSRSVHRTLVHYSAN